MICSHRSLFLMSKYLQLLLEGRLQRSKTGGSTVTSQTGLVSTGQAGVRGESSQSWQSSTQSSVQVLLNLVVLQLLTIVVRVELNCEAEKVESCQ